MRPAILNPLFAGITSISGVGPRLSENLGKILPIAAQGGEPLIRDLLFHMPTGMIDRSNRPEIAVAGQGSIATICIRVDRHDVPPRGNRRVPYRIYGHDETGEITLVYFNGQQKWLENQYPIGEIRYVSGEVDWYNGRASMVHPDYVVSETELETLPLLEPLYPLTAGVSRKVMGKTIRSALERIPLLPEWGELSLLAKNRWPDWANAISSLHQPLNNISPVPESLAWRRLAYDELLAGQLALSLVRRKMKKSKGHSWKGDGHLRRKILDALPYELTGAQKRSLSEILADMETPDRMLRLLQGDVGAGKTIVALLASAATIEAGGQAAIMAPTETLARQHYASIAPLAAAADINLSILTGREKGRERARIYDGLKNGTINLVVGTHALFQEGVEFSNLALGIVDEQHRFGVHQRLALAAKGGNTDILVMTATPIPRTLVLTYFGDMDVSILDEKPANRPEIVTNALPSERLDHLIERIVSAVEKGEKAYWICPLVEDSDEFPVTSAEARFASLQKRLGSRVGLMHGRMKSTEKDAAMQAFKEGQTRLLVATTVVEVGVDVSDATIIVIEHAERFGLAQLHQLRGRVGRGDKPSSCLLLYKGPLGEIAEARIRMMRETNDGFRLAEADLKLRGEGEILGTRQSGTPGFRIARLEHHGDELAAARDDARMIVEKDAELTSERGEALRTLLYLFGKDEAIRLLRAG